MLKLQEYKNLQTAARNFLRQDAPIARKLKDVESYQYLGDDACLPNNLIGNENSKIHRYLSPSAISENVSKEFGKALDILA